MYIVSMIKRMDIVLKSMRMALLCLAVLVYGTPVAASMAGHDMSHMQMQVIAQQADMAMGDHCEESSLQAENVRPETDGDACCQTDGCEPSCSASVNLMAGGLKGAMLSTTADLYAGFTDKNYSLFGDNTNPPPIS